MVYAKEFGLCNLIKSLNNFTNKTHNIKKTNLAGIDANISFVNFDKIFKIKIIIIFFWLKIR